ncbi:MAG: hypothetical protein WBA46_09595 [Thermomicrobiales bacterium]
MSRRLLDCSASDFKSMSKLGLLHSIRASEGRTLVCETVGSLEPLLGAVTNAELAASMGADILLLNAFDVQHPAINALPAGTEPKDVVRTLKRLTGRVIGINLEPVDASQVPAEDDHPTRLPPGRLASVENARLALELGVDFIVLTGNPGVGVSNPAITASLKAISEAVGETMILIAGKMHAAGIAREGGANILTRADIDEFVAAGADIVLLPAPGTVPGITVEIARELVTHAQSKGALTLTAVGTSQEGADLAIIRQIALAAKMTGTDMHHLGDAGYCGVALPENILAYSIAIRGQRHTYARMARSVNR